jgi:hypothetical protein
MLYGRLFLRVILLSCVNGGVSCREAKKMPFFLYAYVDEVRPAGVLHD